MVSKIPGKGFNTGTGKQAAGACLSYCSRKRVYSPSFRSRRYGSCTLFSVREAGCLAFLYGEDAQRHPGTQAVFGVPGPKIKAEKGCVMESQLLCGNHWVGIGRKYPQVH